MLQLILIFIFMWLELDTTLALHLTLTHKAGSCAKVPDTVVTIYSIEDKLETLLHCEREVVVNGVKEAAAAFIVCF